MFDMPLFPSFDCLCPRNCAPRQPQCRDRCRSDEYLVKICGCDAYGNLIVAVKRR